MKLESFVIRMRLQTAKNYFLEKFFPIFCVSAGLLIIVWAKNQNNPKVVFLWEVPVGIAAVLIFIVRLLQVMEKNYQSTALHMLEQKQKQVIALESIKDQIISFKKSADLMASTVNATLASDVGRVRKVFAEFCESNAQSLNNLLLEVSLLHDKITRNALQDQIETMQSHMFQYGEIINGVECITRNIKVFQVETFVALTDGATMMLRAIETYKEHVEEFKEYAIHINSQPCL